MILEEKEQIEEYEPSYTLQEWLDLSERCGRLEAALKDCISGLEYIRHAHGELYGVGWDRAINNGKAALSR